MTGIIRKSLLAVAAAAAFSTVAGTPALAETELSLAHFLPTRHVMHQKVLEPLAARVAEATGGEVTIRIYPSGELGAGPAKQYSRAVDGVADIAFGLQGYTSAVFPRTLVAELPGLFDDADDAVDSIWNNFDAIAPDYERVKVLGVWFNAPAVIATRKKPIERLEDLSGLTIRAPSALGSAVLEAWGANAVTLPAPEIYNALQTGVIDGVYIGADGMRSFKLHEVTDYVTFGLPASLTTFFLVANRDAWDSLSPEHQAAIEEIVGHKISRQATEAYREYGDGARKMMEDDSRMTVLDLSAEETARFGKSLDGVYSKVAADLDAEGIDGRAVIDALGN